ncbi:MAG: formylglycine-generating enzyme family protein [Desulfobacterales bacterium]|nr:formylglycine-generating enzyme family protein [Desulfobacterales bacterium]
MNRIIKHYIFYLLLLIFAFYKIEAIADTQAAFENSIGVKFVLIHAGSFLMGSDTPGEKVYEDEVPKHRVNISNPFYIGIHEITQAQWTSVIGNNPSKFKDSNRPVDSVSWNDVQKFIQLLNKKEGTDTYRLPTEAEWEYAARSGTDSPYFFGDVILQASQYAWFDSNSAEKTHLVGELRANQRGLYDVSGNVWEWCMDWYDKTFYANSPPDDPSGPPNGSLKIIRGGSWSNNVNYCRSALRYSYPPDRPSICIGFRLVKKIPNK